LKIWSKKKLVVCQISQKEVFSKELLFGDMAVVAWHIGKLAELVSYWADNDSLF
jgi:hypothetical protein